MRAQMPPARGIGDILKRLQESDRPTFQAETFVAIAHRRLRLRRLLIAIEHNPKLLEEDDMATPKLQGLAEAMKKLEHGLEEGAGKLLAKIEAVDSRGHAAIAKGHQKVDGKAALVAEIETYVTALEGANGGDPLDGSSNTSDQPEPEKLTVNGVSAG